MAKKRVSKKTKRQDDDAGDSREQRAPRALWTGTINFGLVTIPVRLVTALRDRGIHFHRVTPDGTCRLRQKLVCPDTGKEYDFKETARGYEIAPNQYVIVDAEEIEALQPQGGHGIDIVQFVQLSEIDPIYFDRPYYLTPNKDSFKTFELLRQVMEDSGRVGIAKMVFHDKQYMVMVRPDRDAFRIETLHNADEIIAPPEASEDVSVKIDRKEKELAAQLLDSLTEKFDPAVLFDDFKEKVERLLEKKAKGKTPVRLDEDEKPEKGGKVIDLMGRLRASLDEKDKKKSTRSEDRDTRKSKRRVGGRR